jgi:dTMP kinase
MIGGKPLERFVAIEGSDYSGKETNTRLSVEHFRALGWAVLTEAFPRYGEYTGTVVKRYLTGDFGNATSVDPELASYFFAVDRAIAGIAIRDHVADGGLAIVDRFTVSNMAFQGAKIEDRDERRAFFEQAANNEFEKLSVPRPLMNYFLRLPKENVIDIVRQRNAAQDVMDGHEVDEVYQGRVVDTYDEIAELYPNLLTVIDQMSGSTRKPPEIINQDLNNAIKEVI